MNIIITLDFAIKMLIPKMKLEILKITDILTPEGATSNFWWFDDITIGGL